LIKNGEIDSTIYTLVKITFGEVAGYRNTDLVYAGKLTANLG
jgi:hypothetical protein